MQQNDLLGPIPAIVPIEDVPEGLNAPVEIFDLKSQIQGKMENFFCGYSYFSSYTPQTLQKIKICQIYCYSESTFVTIPANYFSTRQIQCFDQEHLHYWLKHRQLIQVVHRLSTEQLVKLFLTENEIPIEVCSNITPKQLDGILLHPQWTLRSPLDMKVIKCFSKIDFNHWLGFFKSVPQQLLTSRIQSMMLRILSDQHLESLFDHLLVLINILHMPNRDHLWIEKRLDAIVQLWDEEQWEKVWLILERYDQILHYLRSDPYMDFLRNLLLKSRDPTKIPFNILRSLSPENLLSFIRSNTYEEINPLFFKRLPIDSHFAKLIHQKCSEFSREDIEKLLKVFSSLSNEEWGHWEYQFKKFINVLEPSFLSQLIPVRSSLLSYLEFTQLKQVLTEIHFSQESYELISPAMTKNQLDLIFTPSAELSSNNVFEKKLILLLMHRYDDYVQKKVGQDLKDSTRLMLLKILFLQFDQSSEKAIKLKSSTQQAVANLPFKFLSRLYALPVEEGLKQWIFECYLSSINKPNADIENIYKSIPNFFDYLAHCKFLPTQVLKNLIKGLSTKQKGEIKIQWQKALDKKNNKFFYAYNLLKIGAFLFEDHSLTYSSSRGQLLFQQFLDLNLNPPIGELAFIIQGLLAERNNQNLIRVHQILDHYKNSALQLFEHFLQQKQSLISIPALVGCILPRIKPETVDHLVKLLDLFCQENSIESGPFYREILIASLEIGKVEASLLWSVIHSKLEGLMGIEILRTPVAQRLGQSLSALEKEFMYLAFTSCQEKLQAQNQILEKSELYQTIINIMKGKPFQALNSEQKRKCESALKNMEISLFYPFRLLGLTENLHKVLFSKVKTDFGSLQKLQTLVIEAAKFDEEDTEELDIFGYLVSRGIIWKDESNNKGITRQANFKDKLGIDQWGDLAKVGLETFKDLKDLKLFKKDDTDEELLAKIKAYVFKHLKK